MWGSFGIQYSCALTGRALSSLAIPDKSHLFERRTSMRPITSASVGRRISASTAKVQVRCLRCGQMYADEENGPQSCLYHGHMTGDQGMLALAPPHQGIDGEWTEKSGVIVYKWNQESERPNSGRDNWKKRWTCCGVYGEDAPACRKGPHVSYKDGFTMF